MAAAEKALTVYDPWVMTYLVIAIVSAALIGGAAWGIYFTLPKRVEGFIIALAGGALMVSALLELIEPAFKEASHWWAIAYVILGGGLFCLADWIVDEVWSSSKGGGLLVAITLDGIPENLALGVALIGAGALQVAAIAGSIFLSNLPEAAGGAKRMAENRSKTSTFILWTVTALLLAGAAIAGNLLLAGVAKNILHYIRCVAGGAVVGSLATEVFPKAFKEDRILAGVATVLGLALALLLTSLGSGG